MTRWIRVQVSIFDHDLFDQEPFTEREAWLWMITRAAWSETRHRVGSKVHVVSVGSFFVTLREMQEIFKWKSDKKVRGFLSLLEAENMISIKTDAGKTQVSICNYSKYQDTGRTEDAQRTHRGRTKDTNTPIISSSLHSEDIKPVVNSTKKKASRLPDDWTISDGLKDWIRGKGFGRDFVMREFEKFKNFWLAKSGSGATKLDWDATFRNWLLNADEKNPSIKPKMMTIAGAAAEAMAERQRNEFSNDMEQQQGSGSGYNRPDYTTGRFALPKLPI